MDPPVAMNNSGEQSDPPAAMNNSGEQSLRTIYCNDREANWPMKFKGNSISTTKYNFFTFIPKGLFEQFRRIANLYFLMISILSAIPFSPLSLVTSMAPLCLVILASLCKEAHEDWKRFQTDKERNNALVDLLQEKQWEPIPWERLEVGDIVKVKRDDSFPADLLFLASTIAAGVCYAETANLDGETNIKIRTALQSTREFKTPEKASEFREPCARRLSGHSLFMVFNFVI